MSRYFLQREVSLGDLQKGCELEILPPDESYASDDDTTFDEEPFEAFKSNVIDVEGKNKPRFLGGSDVPFAEMKKNMVPITDDGLILKEILKTGTGEPIPEKAVVLMHYDAFTESRKEPFDSTRLRERVYKVLLDDGNLINGLELAVKSMRKEEISRFIVGYQYAYREMGCPPRIPEKAEILYEVEMINFYASKDAIEFEDMTPEEQRKAPFEKIVKVYYSENKLANDLFHKKQYHKAIGRYKRASNLLENVSVDNDEDDDNRKEYLKKLYLNLAQCFIKNQNPMKAIIYADLALKFQPDNIKGLYRMGYALFLTEDFERASYFLYKAKRIKPFDQMINKTIADMERKRKLYLDRERMFCKRVMGQVEETSTKPTLPESSEFISVIDNELNCFVKSDEEELEFSSGYTDNQLEVVKALAQNYGLAFISKIQCGQKINKVAKKNS